MRLFICALVALNVALIHAARLNNADVEQKSAAEAVSLIYLLSH